MENNTALFTEGSKYENTTDFGIRIYSANQLLRLLLQIARFSTKNSNIQLSRRQKIHPTNAM
jgi:hypothetical protein